MTRIENRIEEVVIKVTNTEKYGAMFIALTMVLIGLGAAFIIGAAVQMTTLNNVGAGIQLLIAGIFVVMGSSTINKNKIRSMQIVLAFCGIVFATTVAGSVLSLLDPLVVILLMEWRKRLIKN